MTFTPLEKFSPSGLKQAQDCRRLWGFIYLLGEREPKLTWDEACALTKPVPAKLSKPTPDERAALKAYNKLYRPAFGTEVHKRLELHAHGERVNFEDAPGLVALVMLQHWPPSFWEIETEAAIRIAPNVAGDIELRGTRDALFFLQDSYLLVDYKTTYTFDWIDWEKTIKTVKTPAQLQDDAQANIYALDVMQFTQTDSLACRWIYGRTEGDPQAIAVDFTITRASAEAKVRELVALARELREYMREKKQPLELEGNPASCEKFGGCTKHIQRGGTCNPPRINPAARLVQLRKQKKESNTTMASFRDRAAAAASSASDVTEIAGIHEKSLEKSEDLGTEMPKDEPATVTEEERPRTVSTPAPRASKPKPARANGTFSAQAGTIAALAEELAVLDTAREAVLEKLRAAVG